MQSTRTIWIIGILVILACLGSVSYILISQTKKEKELRTYIEQQSAEFQNQIRDVQQKLTVSNQKPLSNPQPPATELAKITMVLYSDTTNGIRVETTADCKDIFSIPSKTPGAFSIYLPNAKNWQGSWYGYKVMSEGDYQKALQNTTSQGIVKMAQLNNSLFLVAFQPQDDPADSDLLGNSGKPCPLPIVFFNGSQSVQGFMSITR